MPASTEFTLITADRVIDSGGGPPSTMAPSWFVART